VVGNEEVEPVEADAEADTEIVSEEEGDEVEGFGISVGSIGTVFTPTIKSGGGGGPKTPESPPGGGVNPGGTVNPGGPKSGNFDPGAVRF